MVRKTPLRDLPPPSVPERVAEYVRMSTDHQRYSIENQQAEIRTYAKGRGMEVIQTYADPGKSGLTLKARPGLRQLLQDVTSGKNTFTTVLIYDVSRWGRFQDTDESAHYEFLLRSAGLKVVYCAEPFENDGSALAAIMKTIKRTMAAEHSREMSVKIRAAKRRNEPKGHWHGAIIPFGFRRVCVDADGNVRGELEVRQRKYQLSDHVILVPGPPDEIAVVRKVFKLYVEQSTTLVGIVDWLESEGVARPYGRKWNTETVRRLLSNEAYVGTLVRGKFACVLGGANRREPKDRWRRTEAAVKPVLSRALFDRAQAIHDVRWRRQRSDEAVLSSLIDALKRHGRLSVQILNTDPLVPSMSALRKRFGGLQQAYALIGYRPMRGASGPYLDEIESHRSGVKAQVIQGFGRRGISTKPAHGGRFIVDDTLSVSVSVLAPMQLSKSGPPAWRFMRGAADVADLRVILRLDGPDLRPLDYLILPKAACVLKNLTIHRLPRPPYDRYRHDTIEPMFAMMAARLLELRAREFVD